MHNVSLFHSVNIFESMGQSYPSFPSEDETYKNISIRLTLENGAQVEVKLASILGKGGAKRAVALNREEALLLPNSGKVQYWKKSVEEEVQMSKVCESIGLLSPSSKMVFVQWPNSEISFPAYTSNSFSSLPEKGIYVIDVKNSTSTVWTEKENELFVNPLDPFEKLRPESWDAVFKPFIDDLAKSVFFSLDAQGDDTVNFAVVKTQNYPGYEVRAFCFDFSSPAQYPREIPIIANFKIAFQQGQMPQFEEETTRKYIDEKVSSVLSELFSVEFGEAYYPKIDRDVHALKKELQTKYTNQIFDRLQAMCQGKVSVEEIFSGQVPKPNSQALYRFVDYKQAKSIPLLRQQDDYYEHLTIELSRDGSRPVNMKTEGTLGKGGAKRAVKLAGDEVLLLPNNHKVWFWNKSVKEEVAMAQVCETIGLLCPGAEKVRVRIDGFDNPILAYIAKSFASLASQGVFVIDVKNSASSTWIEGQHEFFKTEEEKFKPENWTKVCEPFLNDLAKSIFFGVDNSASGTINVAVEKTKEEAGASQYRARVFAFDFSTPYAFPRPIPNVENIQANPKRSKAELESTRAYLRDTLTNALEHLFIVEFKEKYYLPNEQMSQIHSLFRSLRDQYTEQVLSLLDKMTS